MWWTVIMDIRSFIMETAVFDSWRQPVDGYLSAGSSISIDGIQIIYIYIFHFSTTNTVDDSKTFYCLSVASYKETHKVSTVSHWLGSLYLESWKSRLFQITKHILSHGLRGEIWKAKHLQRHNLIFHMKESKVDNKVGNVLLLFLFSLSWVFFQLSCCGHPWCSLSRCFKGIHQIVLRLNCVQEILGILVHSINGSRKKILQTYY